MPAVRFCFKECVHGVYGNAYAPSQSGKYPYIARQYPCQSRYRQDVCYDMAQECAAAVCPGRMVRCMPLVIVRRVAVPGFRFRYQGEYTFAQYPDAPYAPYPCHPQASNIQLCQKTAVKPSCGEILFVLSVIFFHFFQIFRVSIIFRMSVRDRMCVFVLQT